MGETIHGGGRKVKGPGPLKIACQPGRSRSETGIPSMIAAEKQFALDWVDAHRQPLSDWNQIIWRYAEPALREYKSAAWYVAHLSAEGFEVVAGNAGMYKAFFAHH